MKWVRALFNVLLGLVVLSIVLKGISILATGPYRKEVAPPDHLIFAEIDTNQVRIWGKNDTHFAVGPKNYRKRTLWHALARPIGSPTYVYDNNGDLVDWTHDNLRDDSFMEKWRDVLKGYKGPVPKMEAGLLRDTSQ